MEINAKNYQLCRIMLLGFCSVGLSASLYAYYVETKKEADSNYQAACDIDERISCSAVFASKYGKGFGLLEYVVGEKHWLNQPNSIYGMIFYIAQILLDFKRSSTTASFQTALSLTSNCGSIYLACILVFVLHDICVVCVTIYVVNFFILLCNIARRRHLLAREGKHTGAGTKAKSIKSS